MESTAYYGEFVQLERLKTDAATPQKREDAAGKLTVDATRQLRQLIEALQARRRRRRHSTDRKTK